ncbi:MAG: alkaline phosphatase [Peptococcaceae bacterium BRH_c4a]|nr:MAG: alkaline phosphatase [Peptococcaceae bacterium BRH_c4a]
MFRTKRLLIALVLVFTMLAGLLPAGANTGGAKITILPIDRAKFLAGQKFDFQAEATDLPGAAQYWEIEVNGQPMASYFGKAEETSGDAKTVRYTLRDVAFENAGPVTVNVQIIGDGWVESRSASYQVVKAQSQAKPAKNVILFVGDGMSLPIRTAARVLSKGMSEGRFNGLLEMDQMEELGLITTSGMDSIVTDSANSASAYATGHKSAVNAMGVYPNSTKDPMDDPKVENIVELAKRSRDMATGLVTTSDVTDATPAAMVAHTRRRGEMNAIAEQMLDPVRRPDVILGGGSNHFLPKSTPGSKRKDDRNLISEFEQAGYVFAGDRTSLAQTGTPDKLLGLFHLSNMNTYIDREVTKNPAVLKSFSDQPTLWEMTDKAIQILSKNPNGFFLMVEGASIDKQAHPMDWERSIYDAIELDKAVGVAKRFAAKNNDTLIIVTADHSHGMSITGTYHELDGKTGREGVRVYADAGFPTFEDKDDDGFPDNPAPDVTLAVGWANHPDYQDDFKFNPAPLEPAVVLDGKAVPNQERDPGGALQTGNLPIRVNNEVHTAEDVPVTASGPGAGYFNGVLDNTELFYGMVNALGLKPGK